MPGTPDHPIDILPYPGTVTVVHKGREVARTSAALSLKEANYPPVLYVPRADTDMDALIPNTHSTHCPYKGDASYYDLLGDPAAVWSYEQPFEDVGAIAGYLAFYPDRVEIRTLSQVSIDARETIS